MRSVVVTGASTGIGHGAAKVIIERVSVIIGAAIGMQLSEGVGGRTFADSEFGRASIE